jgi:hypothetical protein
MIRVAKTEETAQRGIAGAVGMVVGVRFGAIETTIVGGGRLEDAALVSLTKPVEETVVIARGLLESTGEVGSFEVVDAPPDESPEA